MVNEFGYNYIANIRKEHLLKTVRHKAKKHNHLYYLALTWHFVM